VHLLEGVSLAFQQIRTEKLKSLFSLLGVIVGVMFLIVVVTVVEGLDRYVREDFTSQVFGVNTVTLRRWQQVNINTSREERRARNRRPRMRFEDADAIRSQLTVPARVAVESSAGGMSVVGDNGRTASGVQVTGASPDIFQIRNFDITDGRAFTAQENDAASPVIVLGFETAEKVFEGLRPVGRTVRVGGFPYQVIGVLDERGSLFGQSLDNMVIAPARSPIRALTAPRGYVNDIIIQAINPDQLVDAQLEVEGIMRVRRRLRPGDEPDFSLETAEEAISFWNNISRILFLALPMLVSISLVVGGIVIMNIMLVSVMERTREIGVRKALGARRRDILFQVLIESATLSTVGASFGVGAGLAIAKIIAAVSIMPAAVAPKWIALGITLGLTVGIVAGVYPAARASKLDPVDALRYE
jgi:putative ABC transport system permease protein